MNTRASAMVDLRRWATHASLSHYEFGCGRNCSVLFNGLCFGRGPRIIRKNGRDIGNVFILIHSPMRRLAPEVLVTGDK